MINIDKIVLGFKEKGEIRRQKIGKRNRKGVYFYIRVFYICGLFYLILSTFMCET
jgi:hypothetical protein